MSIRMRLVGTCILNISLTHIACCLQQSKEQKRVYSSSNGVVEQDQYGAGDKAMAEKEVTVAPVEKRQKPKMVLANTNPTSPKIAQKTFCVWL